MEAGLNLSSSFIRKERYPRAVWPDRASCASTRTPGLDSNRLLKKSPGGSTAKPRFDLLRAEVADAWNGHEASDGVELGDGAPRVPPNHPLRAVKKLADAALEELSPTCQMYSQ